MSMLSTGAGSPPNVCVIGNSHVGALKLAYDADASIAERARLTFFAARGGALRNLRVVDGRLEAAKHSVGRSPAHTSGGLRVIDPKAYDAFLVYGLGLRASRPPSGVYSRAVLAQTLADQVLDTAAFHVATLLRQVSDRPIYVAHEPARAARVPREAFRDPDYARGVAAMNDGPFAPLRVECIQQPEKTFVGGWRTDARFAVGSRRLDIGDSISNELHPDGDDSHMNEAFGRIWFEAFLTRLGAPQAVSAAV